LGTFDTPYEQYAERKGQHYQLIRFITEPEPRFDEEVLPMAVIRFDDGTEIEAWPEELNNEDLEEEA